MRIFTHNDLNELEDILKWAHGKRQNPNLKPQSSKSHTLIVTESVFSMDGDQAPLSEIVALKDRYGAWLMLDEAHGTGLYGTNRRGLAEELGIGDRIEIQMGTLGKALGSAGGYICGSNALIDYLINRARSFIFSTAPVSAAAAAATAGIAVVRSPRGARLSADLWERVSSLKSNLKAQTADVRSAIIPVMVGEEAAAVDAATRLREKSIFVPAIRYPTVARGEARLRVTVTASHTAKQTETLAAALNEVVGLRLQPLQP